MGPSTLVGKPSRRWKLRQSVMLARVQNDGEYSEPFPVTNGVNQGCVLAPTLFSMMSSATLTYAFQDCDAGFPIRYRFGGKLFNLRRLQAKSKVQIDVLDELLHIDYMTKNASTESYGSSFTSL